MSRQQAPAGRRILIDGSCHDSEKAKTDRLDGQALEYFREAVNGHPCDVKKDDMLRSVPGVGPVALTLLAYLPQLGTLNRKQVAVLAACLGIIFRRPSGWGAGW